MGRQLISFVFFEVPEKNAHFYFFFSKNLPPPEICRPRRPPNGKTASADLSYIESGNLPVGFLSVIFLSPELTTDIRSKPVSPLTCTHYQWCSGPTSEKPLLESLAYLETGGGGGILMGANFDDLFGKLTSVDVFFFLGERPT
jgi:hypothetical protein